MREKLCIIHSTLRPNHYYFGSYPTYASSHTKSSQTCTLPEGGGEQADVLRSTRSYCDKKSRTVLDATRDVDIDEAKSRCHSLKARRARPPGGSNERRRLCRAAPVIYCGAVEALVGCLSRGMLPSRDETCWAGMQWSAPGRHVSRFCSYAGRPYYNLAEAIFDEEASSCRRRW